MWVFKMKLVLYDRKLETFIKMKNLKSLYMNLGFKGILEVWRYRTGRETKNLKVKIVFWSN